MSGSLSASDHLTRQTYEGSQGEQSDQVNCSQGTSSRGGGCLLHGSEARSCLKYTYISRKNAASLQNTTKYTHVHWTYVLFIINTTQRNKKPRQMLRALETDTN